MPRKIIDVTAAAAKFDVSQELLRKECRAGHIPHFRIGSLIKFDEDLLEQWITDQLAASTRGKK